MLYIICILAGVIIGYVIKDIMPPDVIYKGKFKQKGTNNVMSVNKPKKERKRRLKRKKN